MRMGEPYMALDDPRETYQSRQIDTTAILLLESDIGRALVQSNTESFHFTFDDPLMLQRFQDVQDDQDQITGSGDGDHLTTSTFTIFGSFDNTRQIEELKREE